MKTSIIKEFLIDQEGISVKAIWAQETNAEITVTFSRNDKVLLEFDMTPNRASHLNSILTQFLSDTASKATGGGYLDG